MAHCCLLKPEGWKHSLQLLVQHNYSCGKCFFFSSYQSRGNNDPTPQSKAHSYTEVRFTGCDQKVLGLFMVHDACHGHTCATWASDNCQETKWNDVINSRDPCDTVLWSLVGEHLQFLQESETKAEQRTSNCKSVGRMIQRSCWGSSLVMRGWSAAKTKRRSSRFHSGISKPKKACQIKSMVMVFFNIHMIVH